MHERQELDNLIELIRQVKPKAALFTTYTISLSFIDAVLLPTLRSVGCRDIFIVADADQLEASLEEAASAYAGRHYWVAPLVPPRAGCFHPKLAYLQCAEQDVLAVGSGNLTQPGQSGQLECLDAAVPTSQPGLFREFSEFASTLALQVNRTSSVAAEFLGEFSQRSVTTARSVPGGVTGNAQLIHTLVEPAADQMVRLWSGRGVTADTLTVLAPFHAPDGGPIGRLARNLGLDKVSIGLDRRSLVAPFQRSRLEGSLRAKFVAPICLQGDRPLHAKVFEIVGAAQTLLMTGSVNGTIQSLETTENVEVSLARWLPQAPFRWAGATPKKFVPNDFRQASPNPAQLYVEANLDPDGTVMGTVSCRVGALEERASALLSAEGRKLASFTNIRVTPEGKFKFTLKKAPKSLSAIQLELTVGHRQGACWLNIAEDLRSTDTERRERQAVKRILEGRFDEQDVFELLSILTRAAQGSGSDNSRRGPDEEKPQTSGGGSTARDANAFNYGAWSASLSSSHSSLGTLRTSQAVDALVAWLNRTSGDQTAREGSEEQQGAAGTRSFRYAEEQDDARSKLDVSTQFETLLRLIPNVLASKEPPPEAALLAKVAGASAAVLMLRPAGSTPWPIGRVCAWLDEYSRFSYPAQDRQLLGEFALAVAAMAVAVSKQRAADAPLSAIKEALFRFKKDWTGDEWSPARLQESLAQPSFKLANDELRRLAMDSGASIMSARTAEEMLLALAHDASAGREPPANSEVEFPGLWPALMKLRRSKPTLGLARGVLSAEREVVGGGCYHCGLALGEKAVRQLRNRHFAVCTGCGKPTFYLENVKQAAALREELPHV